MMGSIWEGVLRSHWKAVMIGMGRGPGGRLSLGEEEKSLMKDLRMKQVQTVTMAMNQTSSIVTMMFFFIVCLRILMGFETNLNNRVL